MNLGSFYWNPDRVFFVFPYINHPVTWYGVLFAIGFLFGYFLARKMMYELFVGSNISESTRKEIATKLTDRLSLLMVIGTIVGARLGHVFFYDWSYYRDNPLDILKVWEGGLASHGGVVGILLALLVFVLWSRKEYKNLTFLTLLDIIVIPGAFLGGCIRIGNFINQEITGIPTTLPWGVIFGSPVDGIAGIPLHPVQLYESIANFFIFSVLYLLWNLRKESVGKGLLSGCCLILIFTLRFILEFLKMPQNVWFDSNFPIKMGQLLSIPFILLGIVLLVRYCLENRASSS